MITGKPQEGDKTLPHAALATRGEASATAGPDYGAGDRDERITCNEAYPILGFRSQQQLNHIRKRLERARNRETGVLAAVPDFDVVESRHGAAERRRREAEFAAAHILVVPEWDGIKWPSGSWTYSRRKCEAIRDRGIAGLLEVVG